MPRNWRWMRMVASWSGPVERPIATANPPLQCFRLPRRRSLLLRSDHYPHRLSKRLATRQPSTSNVKSRRPRHQGPYARQSRPSGRLRWTAETGRSTTPLVQVSARKPCVPFGQTWPTKTGAISSALSKHRGRGVRLLFPPGPATRQCVQPHWCTSRSAFAKLSPLFPAGGASIRQPLFSVK